MEKTIMKRLLSLALAVLMIVALLPANAVHVHAAISGTLDVDGLGLSGDATASGNKISMSATAGTLEFGGKIVSITLTNNKSEAATLSFNYEIVKSGTIQFGQETITGSGTWSTELAAGGTIKINVKAARKTTAQLDLTNIQLFSNSSVTTTFIPAENGSYTVDGVTVTAETAKTQLASKTYQLVATPASGYQFLGWYNVDTGECLGSNATMTLTSTENQKVTAKFISANAAVFETAGANFADLNEAVAYAQKKGANQITLVSSGTVSAGEYTIPAGITLLIPHDNSNAVYTEAVNTGTQGNIISGISVVAWSKPTAYKTMTMAAGANITVNGAICVGGKHSAQTLYSGSPTQSVGMINMLDGSAITLNSGANLYCWGFIYGSGEITAKDGAFVHENFQITDFRGGNATSGMAKEYMVFPLSQYYVQNVEVATTYEHGSHLKVWTSIYMSNMVFSADVDFIGEGAMFVPEKGSSVTKTYDPATDRLNIEISGNASINSMSLSLGGSNIQSQEFPLPINSNISIFIHSGTTTLKQTVAMLPGSELTVDRGAELVLNTGTLSASGAYTGAQNVFIYDADEWNYGINLDTEQTVNGTNYVYNNIKFKPVAFTPSRTYNRTNADLKDVVININGTLTAKGFVYTTVGGASIISSEGTGKFVMENGAGTDGATVQATQSGTDITYLAIPIVSAMLKNADGSYTETAGAEAGAEYVYENGKWIKYVAPVENVTLTFDKNGGSGSMAEQVLPGSTTIPNVSNMTKENCHFAGWNTAADGSGTAYAVGQTVNFTEEHVTLYAQWVECKDENPKDHKCDTCDAIMSVCKDDDKNHACDICSATMGEHVAAEGSHICAYCNKSASECVDAENDGDHNCDICGKENITSCAGGTATCKDAATCTECGKTYGDVNKNNHIGDTDSDHLCDGCGEKLTDCKDENPKDHKCDTCDAIMSVCKDDDKNHTCDYCGATMSQCEDKDGDGGHFCYICEKAMDTACHDGTATCQKKAVCTDCGEEYGDLDMTNHVSTELRYESVEGKQHKVIHACCGTLKETVGCEDINDDHKCDLCEAVISDHVGGEANCVDEAICTVCGQTYGDVNKNNHVGDTDSDHLCNGCGERLTDCKDEDPKNHACDICGEKLSDCEDKNNDHNCDICGAEDITSCVDTDKNHACDICGTAMGEHVQAEGKHTCDYCNQVMSECVDTDKNHACDTCGATMGTHTDADKDHACDYGCSEAIGTCADSNKDHACDYGCGKSYGTCEDADKDHTCDYGCGKVYGEHVQAEGKHTCDYCNQVMSQCKDENPKDHNCDICGEKLSDCSDAENDGDHKCDTCGAEDITAHIGGTATCCVPAICTECSQPYGEKDMTNHIDPGVRVEANNDKTHSYYHECCDVLKETVNCVADTNSHNCGTCNNVLSVCADVTTDNDHNCDICGEKIGDHAYSEGVLPTVITPNTKVEYTFTCNCGEFYTEGVQGLLDIDENTYYINGDGYPVTGLMKVELNDGHIHYYYFNVETAKAEKAEAGKTLLVALEKTNGFEVAKNGNHGIPAGQSFPVDENGILVHDEDTSKNGFVAEANGIYNYVDGIRVYLGLVQIDGDYYYVRSSGKLAQDEMYWVSRTNGLLNAGKYGFDAEGKMILDGIVGNYYYIDGVMQKCGLFELDGKYYYARTSTGELIKGRTYWVTKTNGILYEGEEVQPANYQFNENGEMAIRKMRNGIVEEDGVLYYYRNDKRFYAGLIEIDGELYYVRSNGQLAVGNYWITKTNGILDAGKYTFGEDGKMIK